jgi:hypothetical protein
MRVRLKLRLGFLGDWKVLLYLRNLGKDTAVDGEKKP